MTAAFIRRLGPDDPCADVGANIRYYTLIAAQLIGMTGNLYAIEPSRGARRNFR